MFASLIHPRNDKNATLFVALLLAFCIGIVLPSNVSAQTVNCFGIPAWAANTAYSVGSLVTYTGSEYKCLQGHTSQTGWEPTTTPALWQAMGTCSSSGPTPTPTPKP